MFLLRQRTTAEQWTNAAGILGSGGLLSMPDRRFLLGLLEEHEIVQEALGLANRHIRRATAVATEGILATEAQGRVASELDKYAVGLQEYGLNIQQSL